MQGNESDPNELLRILSEADENVWRKFPTMFRPDTETLGMSLDIGPVSYIPLPTSHPYLSTELKQRTLEEQRIAALKVQRHIAQFDPYKIAITITPQVFALPEDQQARIVYHEVGESIFSRYRRRELTDLGVNEASVIIRDLRKVMPFIDPNKMYVLKRGYYDLIMQDEYFLTIASLIPPSVVEALNEISPTIFEIITSETMKREGNLKLLEEQLRKAKVGKVLGEDHPNFFDQLMIILQKVDWKELLAAFSTGKIDRVQIIMEKHFKKDSRKLLKRLLEAMMIDEGIP
jgi:hypothetical protein